MVVERLKKELKEKIENFEESFDFDWFLESEEMIKVPIKLLLNVDFNDYELNKKYEEIMQDYDDWRLFILELVSPELRDKWKIILDKVKEVEV